MTTSPSSSLPFGSAPENLCILRLSAVGDICHTVPVVRSIQRQWPDTGITWVIGRLEASLVGDIPGIEFIIFDKGRGLRAYADLRKAVQGQRYDALLQMQVSLRASIASLLIPASVKLGFDKARARDSQWLFTNARIAARPRQHVMDGLFGFAEAIGVRDLAPRWDIPIPDEAAAFARQHVPEQGALIISPCSSNRLRNWRNWSEEGYARVVDYAAETYGMKTLLTGGGTPLERDYGEKIAALARHKPINLVGKSTLKQLLALIQRATVLVSPDSGPVHMATAVGTPVIGLYATSNPDRTGPYFGRRWVVNAYPEALRDATGKSVDEVPWGRRVRDARAMLGISVDEVTGKLDQVMSECGLC